MHQYLHERDSMFPLHLHLWMTEVGAVPMHGWFMARLQRLFPLSISGHSMQAGGATALVEEGAAPELTKAAGHWTLDSFERYIQKNLVLLHVLILGCGTTVGPW
jgi:hypothetical protein